MKRYEKMGIDLNTVEGLERILNMDCMSIKDGRHLNCPHRAHSALCKRCKAERLLEEIPVKEVQRGTTYDDFNDAFNDYMSTRDLCEVPSAGLFRYASWLAEKVEVEE